MDAEQNMKLAMIQRIAKDLHNRRLAAYASACSENEKVDTPNIRICKPWNELDNDDQALYVSAVKQVCDVLEAQNYALIMPFFQLHAPAIKICRYRAPLFEKDMYLNTIDAYASLSAQAHDEILRLTYAIRAAYKSTCGDVPRLSKYIPLPNIVGWVLSDITALGVQIVHTAQEDDDVTIEDCAIRLLSPCLNDYAVRVWEKIKNRVIDDVYQCVDVEREGFTDGDVALAIGRAVADAVGVEI